MLDLTLSTLLNEHLVLQTQIVVAAEQAHSIEQHLTQSRRLRNATRTLLNQSLEESFK